MTMSDDDKNTTKNNNTTTMNYFENEIENLGNDLEDVYCLEFHGISSKKENLINLKILFKSDGTIYNFSCLDSFEHPIRNMRISGLYVLIPTFPKIPIIDGITYQTNNGVYLTTITIQKMKMLT